MGRGYKEGAQKILSAQKSTKKLISTKNLMDAEQWSTTYILSPKLQRKSLPYTDRRAGKPGEGEKGEVPPK